MNDGIYRKCSAAYRVMKAVNSIADLGHPVVSEELEVVAAEVHLLETRLKHLKLQLLDAKDIHIT